MCLMSGTLRLAQHHILHCTAFDRHGIDVLGWINQNIDKYQLVLHRERFLHFAV